jgi:DUF1365 family protein
MQEADSLPGSIPRLIHGQVMHRRHRPVGNEFTYPAFCLALPLSKLADLPTLGMAYNHRGLVSFFDRDHGAGDGTALEPWMRKLLAAENIAADGEIVLYAFPRMLGYVFNPVSFWVCHDKAGAPRAVLCEVRNTFGERHNYLLAHADVRPLVSGETLRSRKVFHVSPFCQVTGNYSFRFHFAADRWLARIDYDDDSDEAGDRRGVLLETCISGNAEALSRSVVRGLAWRYRWFTLGVIARIHWQAVKLWTKRVPYVPKPQPPLQRTTR